MIEKKSYIKYGSKAKSMAIGIKDNYGQTLESFDVKKDNPRDIKRLVNTLKKKYDFDLNPKEDSREPIKGGKWLKKDMEW
jgi:hypothetical protein